MREPSRVPDLESHMNDASVGRFASVRLAGLGRVCRMLERSGPPTRRLAQLNFVRARWLWQHGGDREEALRLALDSRDVLERIGDLGPLLVQINLWLDRRRPKSQLAL
jgi:hypothetical protein